MDEITETSGTTECDKIKKPKRIITTKHDYIDELCKKYPLIKKSSLLKVIGMFSENIGREIRNGYYFRTVVPDRLAFYIAPNIEDGISSHFKAIEDIDKHRKRKKLIAFNYNTYIKSVKRKCRNK